MKKAFYKIAQVNEMTGETSLVNVVLYCNTEADEQAAIAEAYNHECVFEEVEEEAKPLTIEERLTAIEKTIDAKPYLAGTWYYRGDKVTFNNSVYTCIAPVGVVCVWSPEEYRQYWSL